MNDTVGSALRAFFSNPAALSWYARLAGITATSADAAADDFLRRSATEDITPTIFFDPVWFRATYRVEGVNAFVSYLSGQSLRFAWPSPLFVPRWYARRYHPGKSGTHPFLDFLSSGGRNDPHPLIDQAFLASQSETWASPFVALEFLIDPSKYRLKPHPLFDSAWYLTKNPDVDQAGVNPLEHYLQFGHREGRNPNRIFNVAWYRDNLGGIAIKKRMQIEPLTHYAARGFASQRSPGPGLGTFVRTSRLSAHGPTKLIGALNDGSNAYAGFVRAAQISPIHFMRYLPGPLQDYNPDLPERILILPRPRVGVMYTPKCASARIVYWWLKQVDLLDCALRFSEWSHDFEGVYRQSREYIATALSFAPKKYSIYKFVRHPLTRALSAFRHCLQYPEGYFILTDRTGMSFHQYLDLLQTTNYLENVHCLPQITTHESADRIRPIILKIEDGLDTHLRMLDMKHGLRRTASIPFPRSGKCCSNIPPGHGVAFRSGPTQKFRSGEARITARSSPMTSDEKYTRSTAPISTPTDIRRMTPSSEPRRALEIELVADGSDACFRAGFIVRFQRGAGDADQRAVRLHRHPGIDHGHTRQRAHTDLRYAWLRRGSHFAELIRSVDEAAA